MCFYSALIDIDAPNRSLSSVLRVRSLSLTLSLLLPSEVACCTLEMVRLFPADHCYFIVFFALLGIPLRLNVVGVA